MSQSPTSPPPRLKRILALDGGGIRGIFSLQILKRIEEIFRQEKNNSKLVLRDEFDFFAGTSTGAIIAAFLAWGRSADEILHLYKRDSREMFDPASFLQSITKSKYDEENITNIFKREFRDNAGQSEALLGTSKLLPGEQSDALKYLLIVMRNASTGSSWPVTNNPDALYNLRSHSQCNLDIPLWSLLRASTAAPTYFLPESIKLDGVDRIFVDGGATPYNNPALIAALMATLPCYNINWPAGRENIHVLSLGTGQVRSRILKADAAQVHNLDQIKHLVAALMHSINLEQDMLCRILGDCLYGSKLDSELHDLRQLPPHAHKHAVLNPVSLLSTSEKKFSYTRYDQSFEKSALAELLDHATLPLGQEQFVERITDAEMKFDLDNLALIPDLEILGQIYAKKHVRREHLFPRTV